MADLDNSFVDEYNWPLCTNREEHRVEKMFLAQVIPKNALLDLGNKMHQVRAKWKLAQFCHKFGENISSGLSGQAGMIQEFKVSPAAVLIAYLSPGSYFKALPKGQDQEDRFSKHSKIFFFVAHESISQRDQS